jgi:magnesium-transporting ATPase (P-type)
MAIVMVNTSSRFLLPFLLGIAGLLAIITSTIIILNNPKIVEITWLASVFIVLGTLIIRFYSLDVDGFAETIKQTDPGNTELDGRKFVNWMTIAMIIGLVATIIIHYSFEIGMGLSIPIEINYLGGYRLSPLVYSYSQIR